MRRIIAFFSLILLCSQAWAGFQRFTIKFKTMENGKPRPEYYTLHMRDRRIRMDVNSEEGKLGIIMKDNGNDMEIITLFHDDKRYMKMSAPKGQNQQEEDMKVFFLEKGETNPCKAMPDTSCRRVGTEKILGYSTTIWDVKEQDGSHSKVWYAPELGFYLKAKDKESTTIAVHVEDRTPPKSLFAPPVDYRKVDFATLMRESMANQGNTQPMDTSEPEQEQPNPVEEGVSDAAREVGEAARDSAMDEIVNETKQGVKDAIRGLFGR